MSHEAADHISGQLSPLLQNLLAWSFANLAGSAPSVLADEAENGDRFLRAPEQWATHHEPKGERFSARAAELLSQGPVLLLPSWERLPRTSKRMQPPRFAFEPVLRGLQPAGPDSLLGVVLPAEVFDSEALWAVDLRTALAERWDILVLLYGQGSVTGMNNSLVISAVLLRPRGAHQPPLKLFRFSGRDAQDAVEKDYQSLLGRGGGRTRHGYVLRDRPDPSASLAFEVHDPKIAELRAALAAYGSVTPLGDLYQQLPAVNLATDVGWICAAEDLGAVRLLGGRDITRDGETAPASEDTAWGRVPDTHLLAPGDLVVRAVGQPSDPGGLILAEVTAQDLPAAATHMVLPLRPREGLDPKLLAFAVMFLRTPAARSLTMWSGFRLTGSKLRALTIPQPDDALTKALDDVTAARDRLRVWQAEAETLLASVFLERTPAAARDNIIRSGQTLRLRVEAAALLDDLGHTVRTRFPYPVASRWRETEADISAGPSQATYATILDTAEVLLCYVAQLALALARTAGIELGAAADIKDKLASGRSGPGLGDWASVLQEVATSRKLKQLPSEHPLLKVRTLLADHGTADARKRLNDRRNDQAHQRRIDAVDLPRAITEALADLTHLLQSARFLADWPLIHLTAVRWNTLTRTAKVEYREMTGDHPVVPISTMTVARNDLESGSLYLRDSEHELHLLRPFLIGRDCPACRLWSTFHVDRVPRDRVVLKSLEHGHVLDDDTADLRTSLQHVHLL
ncbi:hypothetical protein OG455_06630 [Kitasatospora sp. NBC_01287]|uniref:hypothetical protein n=1 Tax=Kitasatospora sp. NBC_01287 TaxID=2903573 RepID=UPI00225B6F51|nr:hypothetical protein [Kitasatospora sp. NBC_01287]MCX4745198.1 hypothetical protein [Kitasatospora sp. NBC_01287]